VRRGRRGVGRRPDAEAGELGVDTAGKDEHEHAVVADEGPHGVAERGGAVALHEEVAVPRHAVPENGRREEDRGAASGGREHRAGERGQRAEEVPPPRARLGVLAQVEAPELLHAPELLPLPRRLAAAPPHPYVAVTVPVPVPSALRCAASQAAVTCTYTYQPTCCPLRSQGSTRTDLVQKKNNYYFQCNIFHMT